MNYNPHTPFSEQDYQISCSKTARTWNAAYNTNIGSFTQIPVNKITLSVDNLGADENLPVGTQMGVLA